MESWIDAGDGDQVAKKLCQGIRVESTHDSGSYSRTGDLSRRAKQKMSIIEGLNVANWWLLDRMGCVVAL